MSKFFQKKYITRIVSVVVCIVTAALLVVSHTTDVQAGDTLEGIKQIMKQNTESNRFLILEVVPDEVVYSDTVSGISLSENTVSCNLSMGKLGYYVKGQEPNSLSQNLVNFPESSSRRAFVEQTKTALKDIWTTESGNKALAPLTYTEYEEAYSLSENDLNEAITQGRPWSLIDYDGAGKEHSEVVSGNRVVSALNGKYTMNYSPAAVTAERDIVHSITELGADKALDKTADFNGEFNPYFLYQESGGYRVKFVKSNGSRGYQAVEAVELNSSNKNNFGSDTLVYTKDTDGSFVYAGIRGDISLDAPSGLTVVKADVTTSLDGKELLARFAGEEATGAENTGYYVVRFAYSEEDVSESTYVYSVADWSDAGNANATYQEDSTRPFVVDYANTGCIKNTTLRGMDFIYAYSAREDGTFYGNCELAIDLSNTEQIRLSGVRVYFRGGFENNEWFKKYVFDRTADTTGKLLEEAYLTVKTIHASELASYEIGQAGLIYFSDANTDFLPSPVKGKLEYKPYSVTNDMTVKTMMKVLGSIVENDTPVMIDESLRTSVAPNLKRLANLLQQKDVAAFYNTNAAKSDSDIITAADKAKDYYNDDKTIHHVNRSIYMFQRGDIPSLNKLFTEVFSTSVVKDGFQEIIDEIEDENLYRKTEGTGTQLSTDINEAVAIKYIISYRGRKSAYTKDTVTILEIEPIAVPEGKITNNKYVHTNTSFGDDTGSGHLYVLTETVNSSTVYSLYREGNTDPILKQIPNKISIVSASAMELIGHEEDLNSEYDMIYIGLNTCYLNTKSIKDAAGNTRVGTNYNDSSMNGYVYTNIGDQCYSNPNMSGLLSDYKLSYSEEYRYSGNDLSSAKESELLEFLDAGYPILVDYNCYTDGYVDKASRMYDFLRQARDRYGLSEKNMIRLSNDSKTPTKGITSRLSWYLNLAKPQIELDTGVAKTDICQSVYKVDGHYYMKYAFDITNKGSANKEAVFDCKLYIDSNSDGKYSPVTEDEDTMVLTNAAGEVQGRSDGKYNLQPGVSYYITLEVPEEYTGPLPWKLEVTQHDKTTRRDSVCGCYAIHRDGEDVEIKVLQIGPSTKYVPDGGSGQRWNLQDYYDNNKGVDDVRFGDVIDGIAYYKMKFTTITADQYVEEYKENPSFLDSYNLLVLGFGLKYNMDDLNNDGNVEDYRKAKDGIANYISQGKSVLVTADVFSPIGIGSRSEFNFSGHGAYWQFDFTQRFRDAAGLDRYGVTPYKEGIKDIARKLNSDETSSAIQGFSNQKLSGQVSDWWNGQQGRGNNIYFTKASGPKGESAYLGGQANVKKLNNGQLTLYPFTTKDYYPNHETWLPYYQLDFESDSDADSKKDAVVWYGFHDTGSNGNYITDYDSMDARNLYYIYSKGNITYYGAYQIPNNTEELELFVNTAVAAFEAGVKPPEVKIIDNSDINSREIDTIYVPYEKINDIQAIDGVTTDVFFYAKKSQAAEKLLTNCYYEVPSTTAGAEVISIGGQEVSVIKIPLTALSVRDAKTDAIQPDVTRPIPTGTVSGKDIETRTVYKASIPLNILLEKNNVRIFIGVTSTLERTTADEIQVQTVYDSVNLVKTQLFNLD